MQMIKYAKDELYKQRLLRRKVNRWTSLEYLPFELGKGIVKDYTDSRWTAALAIKPLLFVATTIMLVGATILIVPGDSEETYPLFLIGLGILGLYELLVGKQFYKAGIDESFVITGTTMIVLAILVIFQQDVDGDNPFQYLICASIAWLAGIRYQNYIAYYGAFLLLQVALIYYVKHWELHYLIFLIASLLTASLGWTYFYRQRINGAALWYQWNETLEVFFITMVAVVLNPHYQDWGFGIYLGDESEMRPGLFSSLGFFLQLIVNLGFVIALVFFGIRQQSRIPLIVAFSTIFTEFLSVWYFYGEDWNVNLVLTFCGASILGFGILLNYIFKNIRWNIVATKLEYQEENHAIFETIKKFRKKINLRR